MGREWEKIPLICYKSENFFQEENGVGMGKKPSNFLINLGFFSRGKWDGNGKKIPLISHKFESFFQEENGMGMGKFLFIFQKI